MMVGPDEPREWAWLVGWFAIVVGGSIVERYGWGDMLAASGGLAIAFSGGVAWQRLNRRDLVDRLSLLSWLAVIGIGLALLLGVIDLFAPTDAHGNAGSLGAMFAAVAGLVRAELGLRERDTDAARSA
jgi:hypothetical protein